MLLLRFLSGAQNNHNMLSVNLFAEPGAGKSTTASNVFAYLKNHGCNVELIREYAKDMVYAKRNHEMANQIALFSKQHKRMDDVERYDHVKMIITDCPILLGLAYCQGAYYYDELKALIEKVHNHYENINVLVCRVKPYNPSGRNQDEKGAAVLRGTIASLVPQFDYIINGDHEGQIELAEELLKKYGDKIQIK